MRAAGGSPEPFAAQAPILISLLIEIVVDRRITVRPRDAFRYWQRILTFRKSSDLRPKREG